MDDLPPLEHEDDPFALLGVTPDVDERELKRAYARKIKVYRPDRAPEAFALIHAAFEHVRMIQQMKQWHRVEVAEVAPPTPPTPPTTTPPPTEAEAQPGRPDPSEPMRALAVAVAADDTSAADAAWKAIRATGVSLEELVVDAPPAIQAWLFEHVPFTWRELSQWRDPRAAFNVWMTAFARRVRVADRLREAVAMASEPALATDAGHDPMPAVLALNAVSCLAWRDQDAAERILRSLRSLVHHPVVARLHDRATLDVELVGREYRIHRTPPLPPHVLELLADWPILPPAGRGELAETVRTAMRADPVEYLEHLSGTVARHPRLADALTHRLLDGVPEHRRDLSTLPDVLRDRLGDELRAASRKTPWCWSLVVVLLGLATTVLVTIAFWPRFFADDDWILLPFAVGSAYLIAAMYLDRYLYQTRTRRLLAAAIAAAGVTRAAAREWLQANRLKAIRLMRFTPWMQADDALRLVGMLAGNVADDRELTSDDDDAPGPA